MDPHTLIVWAMNGKPLPNIHGGPVRLVVPGWAGSASQKWLTRIWIRDKEHDGPGMTAASYRVPTAEGTGRQGRPKNAVLESMPVRSVITSLKDGAKSRPGRAEMRLRGPAWAGDYTVPRGRRLDRFGATWQRAELKKPGNQFRLAALDAALKLPSDGYLRDLDARHRQQGRDAAAPWRVFGIRRATAATPCTASRAGGVRSRMRFALSDCSEPAAGLRPQSAPGSPPGDENTGGLPDRCRDETFYACTACHNFKLVAAQGLTRAGWEDSINLMVRRHNMPPLDGKDREVVLTYLEARPIRPAHRPSGRGWQNPFTKQ